MTANSETPHAGPERPVDPDYPVDPVPAHARKSLFSLSIVLLGFTFFTPTMLAGAQVGAAFEFWPLMGVLAFGSLVLGVYVAVLGGIGTRTGLTTVVMCRYAFGDQGSKLSSLLLGGTQIGWYGVTVATLAQLVAQAAGWEGDGVERLLMVAGGLVMGATAYFGYRGMYGLSVISVPLLLAVAGWVTVRSFDEVGGMSGMLEQEPTATMGVAAAVTIIVGTFASGGTQAPNWTRFARTPGQGLGASLVAFLVGQFLMLFFGAIGAIAFGEPDFVLVLYGLGLTGWGVVFLIGNLWTTNDNTAYNFGVAGAEIADSRSKKPYVIVGVLIGTLLAVTGIYDNLISYLNWLGIIIPPIGGVIIGDWWVRWRHGMPSPSTHSFPTVRWGNIAAYAIGAVVAWATDEWGWGIPPINGILVAVVASAFASRVPAPRTPT
ncbi:cytosine permease [Phytoactinopolyspora endophytica]|uniref:cytosine permease n=1 Tax=Phytoactinopolyspora endophytica TaxID=1642495 RepID=UPI00101D73D1|nr:cytosine permease [Phytoactinopolyspora endophytica]